MTMMTLSFIGRCQCVYEHDHPFPFPEGEGELLRGRTHPFFKKRKVSRTMTTPSFCSRRWKMSRTMPIPFFLSGRGRMPKATTIHSIFPDDEGCDVLEVDVYPTKGSSTALPCGTSGSPLASPQIPSFLQKGEEAHNHDHPFPFPEEEGELLRGRLCRGMAIPSPFLEWVGCL